LRVLGQRVKVKAILGSVLYYCYYYFYHHHHISEDIINCYFCSSRCTNRGPLFDTY